MILSFSVPEMLPYIRSGIVQAKGQSVGNARVKRQTIRAWGPQADRVLKHATFPYRLSLWWKSRTKEREFLGVFEPECVKAYACQIEYVVTRENPPFIRFVAPEMTCLFQADGGADEAFQMLAWNDGFDSPEAFRDYFAPKPGDVFKGILYKW